jgi:hypothetical protein
MLEKNALPKDYNQFPGVFITGVSITDNTVRVTSLIFEKI